MSHAMRGVSTFLVCSIDFAAKIFSPHCVTFEKSSQVHIVAVVSVAGIPKGIAILGVVLPTVLTISLTGAEPFFVTCLNCAPQEVRPVLIHVAVLTTAIVAITGRAV